MRYPSPGRFADLASFRAHWRSIDAAMDCIEMASGCYTHDPSYQHTVGADAVRHASRRTRKRHTKR